MKLLQIFCLLKMLSIFFIVHKIIFENFIQYKLILWQVNFMAKAKNMVE